LAYCIDFDHLLVYPVRRSLPLVWIPSKCKIRKYTFCREFSWGHTLEFLWRWRHYCDVTCT